MFIDLRDVIKSLAGEATDPFSPTKNSVGFRWYGLRQPDYSKKCSCAGLQGVSTNPTCTRCLSTGYLFTDYLVKGYSWMGILGVEYGTLAGKINTQVRNLVVKHNRTINKFDYVLDLDFDPETGKVRQPFTILKQFKVQDSMPIAGDEGRIEFWKCIIEVRNVDDGRPGPDGTTYTYQGNRSNNEPQ